MKPPTTSFTIWLIMLIVFAGAVLRWALQAPAVVIIRIEPLTYLPSGARPILEGAASLHRRESNTAARDAAHAAGREQISA